MFTRTHLKRALVASLIILGSAILFELERTHSARVTEALYLLETGSGASAFAISIILIATI